jgi:hypothetical protein
MMVVLAIAVIAVMVLCTGFAWMLLAAAAIGDRRLDPPVDADVPGKRAA